MNVRLGMYKYCSLNIGTIYAKGLWNVNFNYDLLAQVIT